VSITQLRRDMKGIKEAVKTRPLDVLLRSKGEDLTDAELNKLLQNVPLRQISSDILLTYLNREYGTSYKSIDDLPNERPIEWTEQD
jgi:hypothetical protein